LGYLDIVVKREEPDVKGAKMKKLIPRLAICLAVAVPLSSFGQEWVARYDGPGSHGDESRAIAVDTRGNVYVTGESNSSGMYGGEDYATVKYDGNGSELGVARYGGLFDWYDAGEAVAIDDSGNVYVTGTSFDDTITGFDYTIIKYDVYGFQLWVAKYNGPGAYSRCDMPSAMALDGYGNVHVTGLSEGADSAFHYATVKYSSAGTEQWVARWSGPGSTFDWPEAIAVDDRGNAYTAEYSSAEFPIRDFESRKKAKMTARVCGAVIGSIPGVLATSTDAGTGIPTMLVGAGTGALAGNMVARFVINRRPKQLAAGCLWGIPIGTLAGGFWGAATFATNAALSFEEPGDLISNRSQAAVLGAFFGGILGAVVGAVTGGLAGICLSP
jgi:hypothetical protein